MTTQAPAPDQIVFQMISGFWVSQTLFAMHDLGVFAALADGPATAERLAERLGFDADAGDRLMTAAVALGLLVRTEGAYANSPIAEATLVPGAPRYVGGFIAHARKDLYPLWAHLDDAVRESRPQWERAFGATTANPFEAMYAEPERLREFLYAMRMGSMASAASMLDAYDFAGHSCLLDVGGALGVISVEVAKRHPHLRAITFDLPAVRPLAEEYVAANGLSDRITIAEGDMFADALPKGADVVHLSWILHDWDDERCARLLASCFQALPSGGAILLGESLVDDAGSPAPALMSLNMLVATDGGRERTAEQYRRLLEDAGFVDVAAHKLDGMRDLVTAKRP